MFNKNNFCHIASNNRNEKKAGVFVYKTTDDLATVSVSGYFNDKIVDINLHDLIIHEWHNPTDRTKVQKNVLCVIERTLDNVGTVVIKTKWEEDTEQAIADLQTYVDTHFVKLDGTSVMTGPLLMRATDDFKCAIAPYWDGVGFFKLNSNNSVTLMASMETTDGLCPATNNTYNLGKTNYKWKDAYIARVITAVINNGYDIAVPVTNSADTLALKSQVDDAANSGEQLYTTGVWYAKMYAASTVPTGAEYDGTNYADFSQVDSDNNPIIVIYTGASGAWTETTRITPPANHNGYMTITSKIWDIVEQSGQQGGLVLWSHNQHTFTPYPRIVSFESINITGNSTVVMPLSPTNDNIVNKGYVDNALINHGTGRNVGDIFFTSREDSSLNGAVECDGSIYNIADFTGAQTIGDLLEAGKVPYVSMAQYATLAAGNTDGTVGVFGWDGSGSTTFRVPCLNYVFLEAVKASENKHGNYRTAGAPQISGAVGSTPSGYGPNPDGAFYQNGSTYLGYASTPVTMKYVYMEASRSNSIYGNSTTVQPKSVRYRAMVQLATSASDTALETCTQVLADVATLNTHKVIAFQAPNAGNNYTWYRKYADGWVEQGGVQVGNSVYGKTTVYLPVAMADNTYQAFGNIGWVNESTWYTNNTTTATMSSITDITGATTDKTTTSFSIQSFSTHNWYVCGMAA